MTLNTQAAAQRLGLSESTLEKMRVHGRGPLFLKLGRAVRYRESDLQAWILERLVQSTSQRVAR